MPAYCGTFFEQSELTQLQREDEKQFDFMAKIIWVKGKLSYLRRFVIYIYIEYYRIIKKYEDIYIYTWGKF